MQGLGEIEQVVRILLGILSPSSTITTGAIQ